MAEAWPSGATAKRRPFTGRTGQVDTYVISHRYRTSGRAITRARPDSPARPPGGGSNVRRPDDPDTRARGARDERLADARGHDRPVRRRGPLLLLLAHQTHCDRLGRLPPGLVALRRRLGRTRRRHPVDPGLLRHPAQRGAGADPLRRTTRPVQAGRLSLGQPLLRQRPGRQTVRRPRGHGARRTPRTDRTDRPCEVQALQDQPSRPHTEQRQAQGQRQARQPRGHRRRHGVARRGHGQGRVRRRRLRERTSRTQSETAMRHLASAYPYDAGETFADTDNETTLRGNVDEVSEALRVELAERLAAGGRHRGGGPAHPPRLLTGDRPGDAAPAAGGGRDRRTAQDRHRRRQHGRDGAHRLHGARHRGVRRRAQGRHGQQPHGGALRREPGDPVVNTGTLYT